ncbi:MAG: hypothetical protein EOQ62_04320 [Mesorhizobium sp.]|uniref:hypothetical protein n=1 Tax=Mesorhizobium sp. TaxID=1871066 RepID=UPI000FEA69BF|nr:hypothetical protein [Mesorhizobium sp.]RWG50503.1 MAG: hypothetical protein EOQ62_04320 [Mesorhizobium sp.]RWL05261.1 MAG: hypothetical protein EOR55_13485 [Mesorhizobium sp.]TIN10283.1 MAG: hypothetical protein E5Y14_12230 [Mesorhizobium sp.]TIQ62109.1 MAG: hypothetical protein E5X41_29730 [Mesorhizobium sp.]
MKSFLAMLCTVSAVCTTFATSASAAPNDALIAHVQPFVESFMECGKVNGAELASRLPNEDAGHIAIAVTNVCSKEKASLRNAIADVYPAEDWQELYRMSDEAFLSTVTRVVLENRI